jgi:Protein of unknown function (DUF3887)
MNDDELKKLWQQQPLRNPDVSPEQLVSAMQKQTTQLRRILDARDIRELVACAFVIIIFGIFYFTVYRTPVSRLGDLIVIGSSVFIAWKLVHTRRRTPPAPPGATVVESLQAELNAVRAQSRLLRSVLWWYLLPLGIGILVCTWGSPGGGLAGNIGNIIYTIGVIALYAWIYRLNQRARDKQLLPVEAQLESLIHSAETGEPLGEKHLANLRPMVLSMAAANKAKPVEFKVAFWQLAIYGVPGIVGIWFFLMIGLTLRNDDWKVNERAVETHGPSVRTETNRYFVVTRKLVDLFNAGDYAAVQRLYNPEMSRTFPPKETTDFYTRLATNLGKIETFDGPTGNGYQGWTAFRLDYEHGEMTMSLALDADDKISGIHFKPAPLRFATIKNYATVKNFKSFILHLFSWQHLLWGVLSFLGGLVYTWLIQKTTRRAVGISTLGIHLHNGMNLILWAEIKEVRPFQFLNIRNLWLITESGEKTRMHWTPLERHSDVKAAVENFAPANHPIRKHLPLLRNKSCKEIS